jgi:hypothetical protein
VERAKERAHFWDLKDLLEGAVNDLKGITPMRRNEILKSFANVKTFVSKVHARTYVYTTFTRLHRCLGLLSYGQISVVRSDFSQNIIPA